MPTWCWEKHLGLISFSIHATKVQYTLSKQQKQIQYLHVTSVTFLKDVVVANFTQRLIKTKISESCVHVFVSESASSWIEQKKRNNKKVASTNNKYEKEIHPLLFLGGNRLLHLYVIGIKKRGKRITHKWKANTQKECWWKRCRTRSCWGAWNIYVYKCTSFSVFPKTHLW